MWTDEIEIISKERKKETKEWMNDESKLRKKMVMFTEIAKAIITECLQSLMCFPLLGFWFQSMMERFVEHFNSPYMYMEF